MYQQTQVAMGTFVEVISPDARAADIAFLEIARVEAILSKYDKDSEVSILNRTGQVKAGPDLMSLLKKSKELWQQSKGAFDITVGPLLDIWGFTDKDYRVPQEHEIMIASALVGTDKIIFDSDTDMVKFMLPGMKIDLGAIAKGYAVDCAIKKIKEAGITSCLINAGGDIYCLGTKQGKPWKVAIQDPRSKGVVKELELADKAVATSGDYEQYFTVDGRRYSHFMDPKTGYPVESGLISVTIVAPDCVTADGLATSIIVSGLKDSQDMISRFGATDMIAIENKVE